MGAEAFFTIAVLGLATWRLARIVPTDTIAQPLRDRITVWTYPPPEKEVSDRQARGRAWVGQLLSCQVCLGWWISLAVVVFWSLVLVDSWLGWAVLIWWPAVAAASAVLSLRADQ